MELRWKHIQKPNNVKASHTLARVYNNHPQDRATESLRPRLSIEVLQYSCGSAWPAGKGGDVAESFPTPEAIQLLLYNGIWVAAIARGRQGCAEGGVIIEWRL